jgi:hypothetical protein
LIIFLLKDLFFVKMNTKRILLLGLAALVGGLAQAQSAKQLADNEEWQVNGMTVGYRITHFRKQEVKGKGELERYELTCFVYNQGSCDVGIRFTGNERNVENNTFKLATFDCVNATGARLTSNRAELLPEPHYYVYRWTEKNAEGKNVERSQNILVGYFLMRGGRRETRIIVIVPVGEKPDIRVAVNF